LQHGNIIYEGNSDESINYYLKNTFNQALIPLENRNDRKGNQKLTINNIYIKNNDGIIVPELSSGEGYKIIFEFQKNQPIDPKQLTLVVQFKNDQDEIVTTIATDEQGTIFNEINDKGYFQINIPKLQFREGRYLIHYMISEKLSFTSPHIVIDSLSEAMSLNIIRGDYWNSGILNRPKGFIQESSIEIVNVL
jgi:lipopolysaccharide transport system ATP-binding protein